MLKLTEKAIRQGRTDERTDPNHRKASLLKLQTVLSGEAKGEAIVLLKTIPSSRSLPGVCC